MKLQHSTYLEGLISILESGYLTPPKRKNLDSWSKDYVFFSIVENKQLEGDSIYAPMKILEKYNRYFVHPTSNLYGIASKTSFKFRKKPTEKQINVYMELFSSYDKNKDGYITLNQLNSILKDLKFVPYSNKQINKFDFPSALIIIHKHYECMCTWEYISPHLATRLKIEKQKTEHECTIKKLDKALGSFLIKNVDYCDGGNEIGFDAPIYVKDFECITISKKSFEKLPIKTQERLSILLKIYKKRGLKVKLLK